MSNRVEVVVLETTFMGGFAQIGEVIARNNRIIIDLFKCPFQCQN
jgi:hypothetical protein